MKHKGFTLVEVLVVLGVVLLLTAIVVPSLARVRQQQALQNTTNGIIALITSARTKTLSGADNTVHSVKFETTRAIIFKGTTYMNGASDNQVYTYESPVVMSTPTLSGGGSVLMFDRLRGTTATHGTLQLQLPNGTTRTITVTETGSISRN